MYPLSLILPTKRKEVNENRKNILNQKDRREIKEMFLSQKMRDYSRYQLLASWVCIALTHLFFFFFKSFALISFLSYPSPFTFNLFYRTLTFNAQTP